MLFTSIQKALPNFQPKALLMPEEIWKDIEGYEGFYQVSNLGRVKSLLRTYRSGLNYVTTKICKEKILKYHIVRGGYAQVMFCKDGSEKEFKVHRLVAFAFVEGYFENAQVNHKDGKKLNNWWTNLEWCDDTYNKQHAFASGLRSSMKDGANVRARKVIDTQTGEVYGTVKEAALNNEVAVANLSRLLNKDPKLKMSKSKRNRLSKLAFVQDTV